MWKSVSSVSNQGAKKGRAKRRGASSIKDLNMGQGLGEGKLKVEWPGLNAPVVDTMSRNKQSAEIKVIGVDNDREARLVELRNKMDRFRRLSIPAFERGYTGGTLNGKSIGAPLSINDSDMTGFDTKIINYRVAIQSTSLLGKKRLPTAMVVTGNGNGIIGIGSALATINQVALKKAKANAAKNLLYVDRFENRTLYHDFYKEYCNVKIYASRMPQGYGLKCHRIIKTICELCGIKDLYAKLEGSVNPEIVAKTFIAALMEQKKYQELADEKQLHVVEFRKEMDYYPIVLASPSKKIRNDSELENEFEYDSNLYFLKGRFRRPELEKKPFYANTPGYQRHLKFKSAVRNMYFIYKFE